MHNHLSFYDVFQEKAHLNPQNPALYWDGKEIDYKTLFSRTRELAAGLSHLSPGSRIGVLGHNHPAFFHLIGAAAALNLTLVLINRRLGADELAHIIKDTQPRLLIHDPEMAEKANALVQDHDGLEAALEMDSSLDTYYQTDGDVQPRPIQPGDPFIIIHTAAVQGSPRGAVLSQENILLANVQLLNAYGLSHASVHLNILPLFHIMGLNLGLATLQAGGKNILMKGFDPALCLELIQNQGVTLFGSFPPILNSLLDAAKENKGGHPDLASLKVIAGIDAPDTIKKWQKLSGATFWTMYGQTETSGLITFSPQDEAPGSAGRLSPLARIQIGDDQDQPLPTGKIGEILVRGPLVFQGYWNTPELNEHTRRNHWHHTGDLGMMDENGFLHFKGRRAEKELIKPGGENVFPAEVENALIQHSAIREVCVFGVPDPKFGEGIKAVCSLEAGCQVSREELIQFTGTRIAGYKKPRYIDFVPALPRTPDGEVDRAKIKSDFT